MSTSILNLPQVASNQNQKEATINTATAILECSANDTLALDLTTQGYALSIDEFTKHFVFQCRGGTAAQNLDTPAPTNYYTGERVFAVDNQGSADVTVRPGAAAAGTIVVAAGTVAILNCSGTAITVLARSISSGASFITLADAPHAYTAAGLKALRVKSDATGLEFFDVPADLSFAISGKPAAGQILNRIATRSFVLPTGLVGSQFFTGTLPTAAMIFTFNKVSGGTTTNIGTVSFATTGVATVTFTADVAFQAGDVLQFVSPSTQDATGADIALALKSILQ